MSSVPVAPKAVIASLSDAVRRDTTKRPASVVTDAHATPTSDPGSFDDARVAVEGTVDVAEESRVDACFQRDARVTTPAEFERCLKRPALVRSGAFALHLYRIEPSVDGSKTAPTWRLGLVIPKRLEASAVARNTIKRRWRDAFRRGRVAWAHEFGSLDVVVRMQSPLVPKPAKLKGKAIASVASVASVAPVAAPLPAKVRARERFDPAALLVAFAERLRSRGLQANPRAADASLS